MLKAAANAHPRLDALDRSDTALTSAKGAGAVYTSGITLNACISRRIKVREKRQLVISVIVPPKLATPRDPATSNLSQRTRSVSIGFYIS